MSAQGSWGQRDSPRRGNPLSSQLARLVRGFTDAGSGDSRAVSWPATPRGAFPVSLRWSHHYRQVMTGPVTWLLVWHCHPNIPALPLVRENVHPVPGQREQSLHAKQHINILITWKCGCSLSPPYFLHKRSVSWSQYPWSPTATVGLSDLALCAVYHSGVHSVDSRFLEALCLCFKGAQRKKCGKHILSEQETNSGWLFKRAKIPLVSFCSLRPWRISYLL